jgi:hypothetical protein
MPGLQAAESMKRRKVAPSIAYSTGGVKNREDRIDKPRMRMQNLAHLPAKVGT